jgi:hypothetical protein
LKNIASLATVTVFVLASISACSPKSSTPATAEAATPPGASSAPQPEASHASAAVPAGNSAEGPVLETMDAANYTYVRVKTASGDIWAATSTFKVAVGDQVVVPLENPMANFHSQTLKRDFPVIYFASRITRPGESTSAPAMTGSPTSAGAPVVTEKIAAAPGGVTIESVVTGRKALAGKTVTVRGKVVKYNGAILGFNWLHIQDGSGSAKDGTNDITVTSSGTAAVGDIVTITGTVVLDKDFGAGYSYAVLLQNATVILK